MSNFRSIAAVVAALEQVVQAAANDAVGQATVNFGPPFARAKDDDPAVNICLLRVTPNAQLRNSHMPTRTKGGELIRRSRLALDLHFVLSFYGSADSFEPERMLGAVALALEDQPFLSNSAITAGIAAHKQAIGSSDLDEDENAIRVTPDHFSLEEFTKLWSVFFQVPYVLSAGYLFSHVTIETEDNPAPSLPVTQAGLWVAPLTTLVLAQAGASPGGQGSIVWGGSLWIAGKGMGKPGTDFTIDGSAVAIDAVQSSDRQVRIALETANFGGSELLSGTHQVQALAAGASGMPDYLRQRSNVLAFAVQPTISLAANAVTLSSGANPPRTGKLEVTFSPKLGERQKVRLALNSRNPAQPFSAMLERAPPASGSGLDAKASFSFDALPPGTYLLRAEVDGVPSLPEIGSDPLAADFMQITGPELVLP